MTESTRQRAIEDVARAAGITATRLKYRLEHGGLGDYRLELYVVSQRERVLVLKAENAELKARRLAAKMLPLLLLVLASTIVIQALIIHQLRQMIPHSRGNVMMGDGSEVTLKAGQSVTAYFDAGGNYHFKIENEMLNVR